VTCSDINTVKLHLTTTSEIMTNPLLWPQFLSTKNVSTIIKWLLVPKLRPPRYSTNATSHQGQKQGFYCINLHITHIEYTAELKHFTVSVLILIHLNRNQLSPQMFITNKDLDWTLHKRTLARNLGQTSYTISISHFKTTGNCFTKAKCKVNVNVNHWSCQRINQGHSSIK